MKQEYIAHSMIYLQEYITDTKKLTVIQDSLQKATDGTYQLLTSVKLIQPLHVLLYGLFLGTFGVDRFATRNYVLGALRIVLGVVGMVLFAVSFVAVAVTLVFITFVGATLFPYFIAGLLLMLANVVWIAVDIVTTYPRVNRKNCKTVMELIERESKN